MKQATKKISREREREDLNKKTNKLDLIDIFRTMHSTVTKYAFISSAQKYLPKLALSKSHQISKNEIIQHMFYAQ